MRTTDRSKHGADTSPNDLSDPSASSLSFPLGMRSANVPTYSSLIVLGAVDLTSRQEPRQRSIRHQLRASQMLRAPR